MGHPADSWIAANWMDKLVQQVSSCDGPTSSRIGRTSVVVETFFDEKGALQIKTADGYWCPAARLEIIE